ncbi:MAG: ABC transporter ATP-binding protein [Caldilineaceae bacterium]|nr:ABC transporter ATP-binding protein [Caldilineaceae bacterium]
MNRTRAVQSQTKTPPILSVRDLRTTFHTHRGRLVAVDGVDLDLYPGEVLGVVGESGSGKSVTLRSLVRLIRPPGVVEGRVEWQGRDLLAMSEDELREIRGAEISMIFQEPISALNPVLSVGEQIRETLREHRNLGQRALDEAAVELLEMVGIPSARQRLNSYAHQFSGGMRQRVMIAIALASHPQLLLADEPTTALDVTIQDQILKLILRLKDQLGMSVILVTHDLGVVAQTCDRVAVMYAGRIVEVASVKDIFYQPRHAYTLGLLNSVPSGGTNRQPLLPIRGAPPDLMALPPGCPFAPRCTFATDECRATRPPLVPVDYHHLSACIHHDELARPREVTS